MFVVEEISRISRIKRKGYKSRKGSESAAGPFPSITYHFDCPEVALNIFICVDGNRFPLIKAPIAADLLAMRRTMKLGLRRQRLFFPFGHKQMLQRGLHIQAMFPATGFRRTFRDTTTRSGASPKISGVGCDES